jgi:hypothetical protein
MPKICFPLAFLSVLACTGCATLLRGTHQTLHIRTVPTAAAVSVDGHVYQTPVAVSLRRKETHRVVIEHIGYHTVAFSIEPQWDGVSLVGNLILPGGSFGLVADHVCGADMSFCELADIKLTPTTQPVEPPLVLIDYKGYLLNDMEVARAVDADRRDRAQFFRGEP